MNSCLDIESMANAAHGRGFHMAFSAHRLNFSRSCACQLPALNADLSFRWCFEAAASLRGVELSVIALKHRKGEVVVAQAQRP